MAEHSEGLNSARDVDPCPGLGPELFLFLREALGPSWRAVSGILKAMSHLETANFQICLFLEQNSWFSSWFLGIIIVITSIAHIYFSSWKESELK